MPFGVTWARYISLLTLSFASAAAGSQVVHNYYRPLEDFMPLVEEELQKIQSASPLLDIEKTVEFYDKLHHEFEEYEEKLVNKETK